MAAKPSKPSPFPFVMELPASPRLQWRARVGRTAVYVAFCLTLVIVCVQFHSRTARCLRKADKADRQYNAALAAHRANPTEQSRLKVQALAEKVISVDRSKGAAARWAGAVRGFWAGENIYRAPAGKGLADPLTGELPAGTALPAGPAPPPFGASVEQMTQGRTVLHPNMPFVVILLTPLSQLPPQGLAMAFNMLKVLALLGAIFAAAAAVNHGRHRMGEWVVGLGVLFALPLIISDFQHGNTNVFVLAAIAGHLWLYRRGRDGAAGAMLALAVCLKMTPVLFGLYWLYQRNWRLLGGLVIGLAVMVVAVPLAALGPARYVLLTGAWLENLIFPALLRAQPYPIHINQSLGGVFWRLLMHGNIYYNPEDDVVASQFGYINFIALTPAAGRWILLGAKAAIVAVMAWAVGWRKLPRDDARRGLQWGLVLAGMLILNQRSWDHHAVILLIAHLAIWHALAYGRFARRRRIATLVWTFVAGALVWLMSKSLFIPFFGRRRGDEIADLVEAYGPTFVHFVLIFVLCVVLLRTLRAERPDGADIYAAQRQKL